MNEKSILIRVYGIVIKDGKILLSDEFWHDTPMTKFPGGELQFGESIADCLNREFVEELGVKPKSYEHFMTYDSLVMSIFKPNTQVLPIYYKVELPDEINFKTSNFRYDFEKLEDGAISFRWLDLKLLREDEMTFIADKEAVRRLLSE